MVDSNRRVDVSVTYGARVPVVASPTKKKTITSARRTIVFKESSSNNRAYIERSARVRRPIRSLPRSPSLRTLRRTTYELHPQMYVSR